MADSRFFNRSAAQALKDIAKVAGAVIPAGSSLDFMVEDVASLDMAGPKDLSFFDNVKYKDQFRASRAGACIIAPKWASEAPKGMNLLVSNSPYKAYALAAQYLYPEEALFVGISDKAFIDPGAVIGQSCSIEEGVVIREGAVIGEGCRIEAHAVIGRNVVIGSFCRVGPHVSISHALVGDYVRLYPGVRVGQDGFGFAPDAGGHIKIPQLGRVIIEDHVEIGANTCIDRGSGPDTVIGRGTWIDNLVQIGHNVKVGKGCMIAGQSGIAGSSVLEDYVALGGQAGVSGHLRVGKGARIGTKAGVIQDVPPGVEQTGYPALPIRDFMRQAVLLKRLIKKDETS
ncbi:MAG: UDP-3-O-(3-hydroxymyristoyl)glucosamine N-acyltransferase [Alphaproteobacteria bacterium]